MNRREAGRACERSAGEESTCAPIFPERAMHHVIDHHAPHDTSWHVVHVWCNLGSAVGSVVGSGVGDALGSALGSGVGSVVGVGVGSVVGSGVGDALGSALGSGVGADVVGTDVGAVERVGEGIGTGVGTHPVSSQRHVRLLEQDARP